MISQETCLPLPSSPAPVQYKDRDRRELPGVPLIVTPAAPVPCSSECSNGSLIFSPLDPFAQEIESYPPARGAIVTFGSSPVSITPEKSNRLDCMMLGSSLLAPDEDWQESSNEQLIFSPLDPFAQEISSRLVDLNEDSNDTIVYNNS